MMPAGKTTNRARRTPRRAAPKRLPRSLLLGLLLAGGILFNLDRLPVWTGADRFLSALLPNDLARLLGWSKPGVGLARSGETLSGRVIDVYDGDTATLLTEDGRTRYRIRFYGIDAPELRQRYGRDARDALAGLIENRNVRVEVVQVDRYGRSVGKVFLDDIYLNLWMVLEGHAWHYRAYSPNDGDLETAEKEARELRRGLWNTITPPTPPWRHRAAE